MSIDKFIQGKADEAHHEGKRSELRRIQEAESQLIEYNLEPLNIVPFPTQTPNFVIFEDIEGVVHLEIPKPRLFLIKEPIPLHGEVSLPQE